MLFSIYFGIYLTSKLSNYMILLPFTYKHIQWIPIDLNPSWFVEYAPSFISGELFLEETPLNIGSSEITFVF